MSLRAIIAIITVASLAGCGGSSGPDYHALIMKRCTTSRSSCECALSEAQAQGDSLSTIYHEEVKNTVLGDNKLMLAGLECRGK